MPRLKREVSASSLLECIVAAVIWLVAFMITMELITRIVLQERTPEENLKARIAVKQCFREYSEGTFPLGMYSKTYDWGTVEMELMPYRGKVQRLRVRVCPLRGTKGGQYDYLIKSKYDEI